MRAGLLFITALGWEARAVGVASPDRVIRTGIGAGRAGVALDRALADGPAEAFVSTGCAGALVDGLEAGTLVLADRVALPDGDAVDTDAELTGRLREQARNAGVVVRGGTILGTSRLLADSRAKRRIAERSGCVAVDMESGAVAARARREGLPFAVARVILDGVDDEIPPGLVDPDGRIRPGALLAALLRPGTLRALVRLGRARRRAEAALRALYAAGSSRASPPM